MQEEEHFSIDLKVAAFKALLQGPLPFIQFSARLDVTREEMQRWLDDAAANLSLAVETARSGKCKSRSCASSPLLNDERKILLGKAPLS